MSPIAAAASASCWAYLVLLRRWRSEQVPLALALLVWRFVPLVIVLVSFSVMQRSL